MKSSTFFSLADEILKRGSAQPAGLRRHHDTMLTVWT